jgi:superfamily II DNA or RNA helicase
LKIQLHNIHAIVKEATEEERLWLANYLSFDDASSRFKTGNKGKAAKMRLFNRYHNTFPAGLYGLVRRGVLRKQFTLELDDKRVAPVAFNPGADLDWLRWYQLEGVDAVVQEITGIVQAPTGSGKTEIAIALTQALPCLWLFLVHRKTLVNQAANRFELRTGNCAMVFGADGMHWWDRKDADFAAQLTAQFGAGSRLIVATFQTFVSALKRGDRAAETILDAAEGLIVDESHVLPADTFYKVAQATKNAYWRVGLSGTPLARGDRRSVKAVAALGPVIHRIKSSTLIAEGVLAEPLITMVPVEQYSAKPTYQGIYGELVVRSTVRHQAVVDSVTKASKPCMVFVKQINHGNEIKKRLEKAGFNTDFVSGKESEYRREAMKTKLERGDTDVLVASVVFQEGVDIPNLQSVVMAHGGKSIIATLQRIGRGMRTDGGRKSTFEVWDIHDQGCSMLEKHSRVRRRAYEREGYKVNIHPHVYRKAPNVA